MKQSHCVLDRPGKPSCRSRTEVTLGNEQVRSGRTADSSSHPSVWKWQGCDDNNMTYLSQNPQIYFNSSSVPFSWACYITSVITYSGGWSRKIKASLDDTKAHLLLVSARCSLFCHHRIIQSITTGNNSQTGWRWPPFLRLSSWLLRMECFPSDNAMFYRKRSYDRNFILRLPRQQVSNHFKQHWLLPLS